MATFTNFGYFNQSSSGAPALTPTAGAWNALLHYALTTISNWTRTFHDATNNRDVWQPAAGGATPVLTCKHNSADSGDLRVAVVRAAESASSTTAFTDPFPQVAQVAETSCLWLASTITTAGTARDYHCVVWESGIIVAVRASGATDVWEINCFGKAYTKYTSTDDPYPWIIAVRNSTNVNTGPLISNCASAPGISSTGNGPFFAMRNAAGTIKGERLIPYARGSIWGGSLSGNANAGAGYLSLVERNKALIHALGTNAAATIGPQPIADRFCFPNIYPGDHPSYVGIGEADTMSDPSHTLIMLRAGTPAALLLETSNAFTGYPAG